jgi:hypothetical protein
LGQSSQNKVAMAPKIRLQNYPRIQAPGAKLDGFLDSDRLKSHPVPRRISKDLLADLIREAILNAEGKSSRTILNIPDNADDATTERAYADAARSLFRYFHDYPSDPAVEAQKCFKQHYRSIASETFRNGMLQKGRMNSGWRYQFLAVACAANSGRFRTVSDIGMAQSDFNVVADCLDKGSPSVHLYISVKNRRDTLGGQDWPKAIAALENDAMHDRNRTGPYCCVFGITIDRGDRSNIISRKTKRAYSENAEVWLADFFWPFFSNYSYEEIMTAVLEVLVNDDHAAENLVEKIEAPPKVLDGFGQACQDAGLLDADGMFSDPLTLVRFFCRPLKSPKKARK